jgi:5'-nucleotidase
LDYFDLVIAGARKPAFLLDPYLPLFRVNTHDCSLENIELGSGDDAASALSDGKVFQGGNWNHLHRLLKLSTGSALLYVGDHMYSDILRSKRTLGWRTLLIVPELTHEVLKLEESEGARRENQALRAERLEVDNALLRCQLRSMQEAANGAGKEALTEISNDEAALHASRAKLTEKLATALEARHASFHPLWGQLFKAGHQNSRWAQQVQDYACLYTSHATNLMYATSDTSFRALTDLMPHDRACIEAAAEPDVCAESAASME